MPPRGPCPNRRTAPCPGGFAQPAGVLPLFAQPPVRPAPCARRHALSLCPDAAVLRAAGALPSPFGRGWSRPEQGGCHGREFTAAPACGAVSRAAQPCTGLVAGTPSGWRRGRGGRVAAPRRTPGTGGIGARRYRLLASGRSQFRALLVAPARFSPALGWPVLDTGDGFPPASGCGSCDHRRCASGAVGPPGPSVGACTSRGACAHVALARAFGLSGALVGLAPCGIFAPQTGRWQR